MTDPAPPGAGRSPEKRALIALRRTRARLERLENAAREPIAIVGMAGRFPGGANGPEALWELVRAGVDAVSEVPPDRWDVEATYDRDPTRPGKTKVRWGGFVSGIDLFDAAFFGITAREACRMDPQQRLLLEGLWEALEDAGIPVDRIAGTPVGVFLGAAANDYLVAQGRSESLEADPYLLMGSAHSIMAGRLSYLFDFRGPSLCVDTACSSSLVAVHYACESLRRGESSLAVAGGANLMLVPEVNIGLDKAGFMSADGRCKAFDARADGFVRGEGCGVVVLKRLSDALADGDRIRAVIRGSAVNQDGHSAGLTAPNALAQRDVIARALENAGVEPARVGYVEAHGTGTTLGDPIEVEALTAVLGRRAEGAGTCALGSVKANLGHLEAAAGIASLIKTVLALEHAEIPPHPHFRTLNPHISLDGTRFLIPTERQTWPAAAGEDGARIAGVSSFGFSGTNAHVVVQEAPRSSRDEIAGSESVPRLLPISARSPEALVRLARAYAERLRGAAARDALRDICYSASERRSHLSHRLAVVASGPEEMTERLLAFADGEAPAQVHAGRVSPGGSGRAVEAAGEIPSGGAAGVEELESLAALHVAGVPVAWERLYPSGGRYQPLPSYPWEHERYWFEAVRDDAPARAAAAPPARPTPNRDTSEAWFHELCWHERARGESIASRGAGRGVWLILSDRGGVGVELAELLARAGDSVTIVSPADRFERAGEGSYRMRPACSEDVERVLAALPAAGPGGQRGIVHLWGLEPEPPGEDSLAGLERAQSVGAKTVLRLLRAAEGQPGRTRTRVWIATAGTQALGSGPVRDAQAPLWGLGRVAALESGGVWGGLIDLDPEAPPRAAARSVFEEITGSDGEPEVAFRRGVRHVPRLEKLAPPSRPSEPPVVHPDGSYLITGGLGGLGLAVADWLVRRGARHLVFVNRTRLPPRAEWSGLESGSRAAVQTAAVEALEAAGATVRLAAFDVGDEVVLRQFRESLREEGGPPLRGVIHAAGVYQLRALGETDDAEWDDVVGAKLRGAWLLDRLFGDEPLDFFVCFSSIVAIFGSAFLGSYAAANAYLDALVHRRRALGKPAQSVNWGPWAEAGMLQDLGDSRFSELMELGMIRPSDGVRALGQLMGRDVAQAAVIPVDWSALAAAVPEVRLQRVLEHVFAGEEEARQPELRAHAGRGRDAVLRAGASDRIQLIEAYLRDELATALGVAPESIASDRSLIDLGLDSLKGVALKNRIERDFETVFPLAKLVDERTLVELAALVAVSLEPESPAVATARPVLASALPQIVPAPHERGQPFPLTDVQLAYWIGRGDSLELGGVSTHGYREVDTPLLDVGRLERVLQGLIDRHEMLRAIVLPDGSQRILESVPLLRLPVQDLRALEPAALEKELAAIRSQMSHQVLPADRWPLFDFRVSLLPGNRSRLHVSIDMLIADFASLRTLLREGAALLLDPEAALPPIELSFRDYVQAERAFRSSPVYATSQAYWSQRVATLPGRPELPLAGDPGALGRPHFERLEGALAPDAWARLRSRAAGYELTPSGVLLAAFAEVLRAWSKNAHFAINLTLFNRLPLHPQVEDVIGDFTTLTLLEVDPRGAPTFGDRARKLQRQLWQDLDHRHVSGVQVLRDLIQQRGGISAALLPVVFTSTLGLDEAGAAPASGDADLSGVDAGYSITQTPQIWLDNQVFEHAGALLFNWDFPRGLFPEGVLEAMFAAYRRLLGELADEESAWTASKRDLVPAEQLALRRAFNATTAPVPEGLLHSGFVRQARLRPERDAVVAAGSTLSYGELALRSARVARVLRERGARPNELVAVVMEKGWEQVVAVLGVLQSGAAYLPIDALLPPARVAQLLEQGEARIALTQSHLSLDWPAGTSALCVDDDAIWADASPDPPEPVQGADDLAYVIFTSGSTGTPKGVMIEHRAALNTVADVNARFGVDAADRVLGVSSLSFDLSVQDVFGTLAAGATLVLPQADRGPDPAHWCDLAEREGITLWNSVPALLGLLLDEAERRDSDLSSLRQAWLSGDWIPIALAERLRRRAPRAQVVGMGGATEASIWSIHHRIADSPDPGWQSVPYGRPLANQRFHVLDENLDPCPSWVPGELYIGGAGLARGYWKDEAQTAERFVVHPETGERLYRTGDWGRFRPEGEIEFLGRDDLQVKVQGHRIELGEIESVLEGHPSLRSAVVAAHGEPRGAKRLVAYVVPERTPASAPWDEAETLQGYLRERLPDYMVPSLFVALAELPLSANGKIDRRALPAPDGVARAERPYVPPSGEVEERLAAIWAQILGSERVGTRDNFFELGGDSIGLVTLRGRILERFGVELPIVELFRRPTIATLAPLLDEKAPVGAAEVAPIPAGQPARDVGDARLAAMRRRARLQPGRAGPRSDRQ